MIPYTPDTITSPGETMFALLKERGMNVQEVAIRAGYSGYHIKQVILGKHTIDSRMALELERILGVPANYWLNHEAAYRASLEG